MYCTFSLGNGIYHSILSMPLLLLFFHWKSHIFAHNHRTIDLSATRYVCIFVSCTIGSSIFHWKRYVSMLKTYIQYQLSHIPFPLEKKGSIRSRCNIVYIALFPLSSNSITAKVHSCGRCYPMKKCFRTISSPTVAVVLSHSVYILDPVQA